MQAGERLVGRIVKAHGLRGEFVVAPSTDHMGRRFAPGSVLRVDPPLGAPAGPGCLTVTAWRWHGDRLLVSVEEVGDRRAAEALRAAGLAAAPLADDPSDDPDEFHDHQLEGLAVDLRDGTRVGEVVGVVHGAGGELLAVAREAGEVLVPFVRAIVREVDLAGGRLVLDPPEGLLDPS